MKKLLTILLTCLCVLAFSVPAMAAAQVMTSRMQQLNHELYMLVVYCKCDTTKATWTDDIVEWRIDGEIICVDVDPGATAPQDNYDPVLKNKLGIDIMGGALENRDTANSERVYPEHLYNQVYRVVPVPVEGCLEVEMSGNNVTGADWTLYIYFTRPSTTTN